MPQFIAVGRDEDASGEAVGPVYVNAGCVCRVALVPPARAGDPLALELTMVDGTSYRLSGDEARRAAELLIPDAAAQLATPVPPPVPAARTRTPRPATPSKRKAIT